MLRRPRRETPPSGFTSPHAVPPTDLLGWAALSLAADYPAPTGNAMLDMHNDAITNVQAYLNGRAVSAPSDEERAYLLRLRADLNYLLVSPTTDPDEPTQDTDDTENIEAVEAVEAVENIDAAGERFYVHCGCDQHGDQGGCAPACADNFGCTRPEAGAA